MKADALFSGPVYQITIESLTFGLSVVPVNSRILCSRISQKVFSGKVFRRAAKNSSITLLSQIVVMLAFLVQVKIIYGGMGTAAYGSLGLIIAVNETIRSIFDFRVYECLQLRLTEYWQKDDTAVRNVLKLGFWLSVGSGIASYGLLLVAGPSICKHVFHNEALIHGTVLYGATQWGICFTSFNQAVLRFFLRFKAQAYILIVASVLRVTLLAGISALGQPNLGQVIWVYVFSILFEQAALLAVAFRCVRGGNVVAIMKAPFKGLKATFRSNRSILMQTFVLSSVKLLTSQVDMFLAGHYFAPGQVGHYRLAKSVVTRLAIITMAMQAAVFPELLQLLAKSRQQAKSLILKLNMISTLVFLPMGILLFVLAPWVLRLFANGQDVNLATLMIRIVVFPLLFYEVCGIWLYPLLIHFQKISLMSYATLASSALALCIFFLLKRLGIVSVVFLTSTTFVVTSLYLLAVAWLAMRQPTMERNGAVLL